MGIITFVNRFSLTGTPEEFEAAFARSAEFMAGQPGLLGYTLSRSVDAEDQYINIALWTDVEAVRQAASHPEFPAHVQALRAVCTSSSELYTERRRHLSESIHTI